MNRVLIFSLNYYPHYIGGAEVAIKEITDRFPADEFEFHLVTLRIDSTLPKEERIGNVIVHRIGFTKKSPSIAQLRMFPLHLNKYFFQFGAYAAAVKLHNKVHFDIAWAMMAHSCAIPAGLFKKRFPNVKYVLTLQEGDPPEHIERMMKPLWWLFKQGFTGADALQPISTFLQNWGVRMGFKGVSKVIPNAVDVVKFAHVFDDVEIAEMKQKLKKGEGEVFVVTTSRLVHKNGIDTVIQALPFLPEHISFLIYGIGPDEAKLRSLAKEVGVESRARFMGQISHDEMPLMLRACDIFTRPSRSEGMGNSFIEAMAAELPVIATQVGGIADFLFDEKSNPEKSTTGWSVPVNSPQQIATAVTDILSNPDKVAEVTKTAKAMVIEKYDWNLIAKDMREVLKKT